MLGRLFSKKTESTIGLDKQGSRYYAVRVEKGKKGLSLTHQASARDLKELPALLEPAKTLVSRPFAGAYFDRRTVRIPGNWKDLADDKKRLAKQGVRVFEASRRWTNIDPEEAVFGWSMIRYDSTSDETEVEVHQFHGRDCAHVLQQVGALKLGEAYLDSWHCTGLSRVVPSVYRWFILETVSPDGFALMRDRRMAAHIDSEAFLDSKSNHPHRAAFLAYLEAFGNSDQPWPIQAFFLTPKFRPPDLQGISCSWIGENCRELVKKELPYDCLQALGLALSDQPEWWLHHISEFRKK